MKRSYILSSLLLPAFAMAAPFCAVTGSVTTCVYYDEQVCHLAAGPMGYCVVNPNEAPQDTGYSQSPPNGNNDKSRPKRGMEQDNHQRPDSQESILQQPDEEQRQQDLDRQNMERRQKEQPGASTASPD